MTGPTLCAIPTCRQRNRHLPGCVDDCLGCLPRATDDGIVCTACADRAERLLAEIERLTGDARLVAAGQVRRGHGGTGGKPGSRSPANDDALDVMDAIQNALTTMAREIAEERGLHFVSTGFEGHRVADPVVEASSWLSGQLSWLRHATLSNGEPYAADVFREIGDCAARMRSLVDGPREQKYLGPCGADIETDVTTIDPDHGEGIRTYVLVACEGDVYGVAGAQTGRCRTCRTEYQQADRRIWLDEQVSGSDLAWTARGIADALSINVKTVRDWATPHTSYSGEIVHEAKLRTYYRLGEHIVPWTEPEKGEDIKARGPRLHYVGDVRRLAKEAADRRAAEEGQRGELTDVL